MYLLKTTTGFCLAALFFGVLFLLQPVQAQSVPIDKIVVEGAQRIEDSTIYSYMNIEPGENPSARDLDAALKALFETGLFSDVSIRRDGNDLVVTVAENPVINQIAFEGNRRITDDILMDEVSLRPRVVFTRSRVQTDMQRIRDVYRSAGRYTVKVEPKIVELSQNRVDLIFEIDEGPRTSVRSISFVGNEAFSDGELRDIIQTKESAWYRFLSSADSYDPDRIAFDKELLRRHYLSEGYADFQVISANAELTPDNEAFFVTFTLTEGSRYKFGEVGVSTTFQGLVAETLADRITVQKGEWYDGSKVEESINRLTDRAGDLGYAFVEVAPDFRRDRENLIIDTEFKVQEGPRVFVERIEIAGNIRTLDSVIRREMFLVEGDAYNSSRLRRSRRAILNLGFFETVDLKNEPGSTPDKTLVKVVVAEKATGSLSFGAGYSSSSGMLATIDLKERNLLGRGQNLRLGLNIGDKAETVNVSFTEPRFLGRHLRAGFDVFRSETDVQTESSYDHITTGMSLRMGYRISGPLNQSWKYSLHRDEIENIGDTASAAIRDAAGEYLTSSIGHRLVYDERDSRFTPTTGYVVEVDHTIAGLGGDTKYLKNRVAATHYFPFLDDLVFRVGGSAGYIDGLDQDIQIFDRFFLGGSSLRGFKPKGLGPRDTASEDALGGNWYYRATVGLTFPLGLPNEFGIKGRLFSDAGSLGSIDGDAGGDTDTGSVRVSVGAGLSWDTPLGPMNIDLASAIQKEEFDLEESFRFSFGANF